MQETPSFWNGQAVLVTGVAGFIGTNLSNILCELGAKVVGLVRRLPGDTGYTDYFGLADRVTLKRGNIEDFDLLERLIEKHRIDTVFHLAGQSQLSLDEQNPMSLLESNVRGSWHILEAVRRSSSPAGVILSSSQAVNRNSKGSANRDSHFLEKLSPYAASKACVELIGQMYSQSYGLPVAVARCSNVYGGGDLNFDRLVPSIIQSVLKGEAPVIRGNGNVTRDFIYIKDVVNGFLSLGEAMDQAGIAGNLFNFSSGHSVSVSEMVHAILDLMHRTDLAPQVLGKISAEFPKDDDNGNGENLLGWAAETNLETGLNLTIGWYEKYRTRQL